jgi:stage V sporulation protein G
MNNECPLNGDITDDCKDCACSGDYHYVNGECIERRNMLEIEVSRLHKLDGSGSTKAFCDISVMDAFIIKGIRIVEGDRGLFVSMPREEGRDGKWYNTVIPLNREVKDEIEKLVLEAYGEFEPTHEEDEPFLNKWVV